MSRSLTASPPYPEGVPLFNAREAFKSRNEIGRFFSTAVFNPRRGGRRRAIARACFSRRRPFGARCVKDGRGLRDGQAGEVAELDHFRRLDGREPVEGFVEGEEAWDGSDAAG